MVHSSALEQALFLEADRMRALTVTEDDLRDRADLDSCAAFFETCYAPGNAVLTVAGDFTVSQVLDLIAKHFGDVPARETPQRPLPFEPLHGESRGEHYDRLAPLLAFAIGYQLPDPVENLDSYPATVVLAALLTGEGRLRRLTTEYKSIADIGAVCGVSGPFNARNPDMFIISVVHLFAADRERYIELVDRELDLLSRNPPDESEIGRVVGRWTADHYRHSDLMASRARLLGSFELLYNDARIFDQLVGRIRCLTPDDVSAAAGALRSGGRAILTVRPNGDRQ